MDRLLEINPVYTHLIPENKEFGLIYISKEFEIAEHLCACGCGGIVATTLGKGGWQLTERDGKVTLYPSIGNWSGKSPYHAHYFIKANKIDWC